MRTSFLSFVSLLLLGAFLLVPVRAQNYRVKAERYERGLYSPETNPASLRYTIVDLGPDIQPIRITNSGYILCQSTKFGKPQSRWYQGQFQELTGGSDPRLLGTRDINESGTIVGNIIEYRTGSVRGPSPCTDSASAWYRNQFYGIRRAAKWTTDSGEAITISQPSAPFSIYDCTNPTGPPYIGRTTFGGPVTIDNDGKIYGEVQAGYAEHQTLSPDTAGYYYPTVWGNFYAGYSFTENKIFGDKSLLWDPDHNVFTTLGKSYYISKARNGNTIGYDTLGGNFVNGLPVDFVPITINSQGRVLMTAPGPTVDRIYIYDPATSERTDVGVRVTHLFPFGQFTGQTKALNHRTIATTDAAGQPVTKVSPQVVGHWGTANNSIEGATIWEENPKTGQYWMQYLNLLIPPDSGWDLRFARDINDNGEIICTGWFRERDADGQLSETAVMKACKLVPINP